jgi:hypothetical protein
LFFCVVPRPPTKQYCLLKTVSDGPPVVPGRNVVGYFAVGSSPFPGFHEREDTTGSFEGLPVQSLFANKFLGLHSLKIYCFSVTWAEFLRNQLILIIIYNERSEAFPAVNQAKIFVSKFLFKTSNMSVYANHYWYYIFNCNNRSESKIKISVLTLETKNMQLSSADAAQILTSADTNELRLGFLSILIPQLIDPLDMKDQFIGLVEKDSEKNQVATMLKDRSAALEVNPISDNDSATSSQKSSGKFFRRMTKRGISMFGVSNKSDTEGERKQLPASSAPRALEQEDISSFADENQSQAERDAYAEAVARGKLFTPPVTPGGIPAATAIMALGLSDNSTLSAETMFTNLRRQSSQASIDGSETSTQIGKLSRRKSGGISSMFSAAKRKKSVTMFSVSDEFSR